MLAGKLNEARATQVREVRLCVVPELAMNSESLRGLSCAPPSSWDGDVDPAS